MVFAYADITAEFPWLTTATDVPTEAEVTLMLASALESFEIAVGTAPVSTTKLDRRCVFACVLIKIIEWYQARQGFSNIAGQAGSSTLPSLEKAEASLTMLLNKKKLT